MRSRARRLDPGDELLQLLVGARPGQRRAAHVVGDVEVLVVDPHRVGEPARDLADPLPVARDERDALSMISCTSRSWSKPSLGGSNTMTEPTCIGVVDSSR